MDDLPKAAILSDQIPPDTRRAAEATQPPTVTRKGRLLRLLAKLAVTVLLLVVVFRNVDPAPVVGRLLEADWRWMSLATGLFLAQLLVSAVRWYYVCGILQVTISRKTAVRLFLIGHFFSQTLPSGIGGDAVRAWLLTRSGTAIGRAVSAVVCDRVFAMAVLLGLSTAMIPLLLDRIPNREASVGLSIAIGLLTTTLVIGAAIGARLAVGVRHWKLGQMAHVILRDVQQVFYGSSASIIALLLAAAVHTGIVLCAYALAQALNVPLPVFESFLMIPPIMLASVIPISVAGWGVREGAMIAGLALIGVPKESALAVSISFGLVQLVLALPGAALWAFSSRRGAAAARA